MNFRFLLFAATLICTVDSAWSDSDKWSGLLTDLEVMAQESNVPAMGLVIMDDAKPAIVQTWGENVSINTPFRWGSISKSFTALALLRLVEDRRVELSDHLQEHIPGIYENSWSKNHPVLLKHLLELTAGFSDLSGSEFSENLPLTLEQSLALNPTSRVTRWPPGLQHNYSNLIPGLTSVVVEQVSGEQFETFMEHRVLRPLQMFQASFQPVADLPGGFKADGLSEIPYWHMSFRAFGALNASLAEMSNFLSVLMNEGRLNGKRIFEQKTLSAMYHPETSLGVAAGLEVAYGAGMYGWVSTGHVFKGHGGDADGYRSRYGILRDAKRGYLIVINTDNPRLLRSLQKRIESHLTADLEKPTPPPTLKVEPQTLTQYTGTYYPAAARFGLGRWQSGKLTRVEISLDENGLLYSRGRHNLPLIPLGGGRFRRGDDPVATVVFVRDESNALFIQGELGNFVKLNSSACPGFITVCNSQ